MDPVCRSRALQPGDPAPVLTLPAVNRQGTISLEDYRGVRGVLIGLFRGLHCPFCRCQLVQLSRARTRLEEAGIDILAVVNTPLDRARMYFEYRPAPFVVLSDPEAASHRAFRVPAITFTAADSGQWPDSFPFRAFASTLVNPTGELAAPANPLDANTALNALDGFHLTPVDEQILATHGTQLVGHFLIDRSGIIRWTDIEAPGGPSGIGVLPKPDDLIAAVLAHT